MSSSLWVGDLVRLRAIEPDDDGYYLDFAEDTEDERSVFRVEPPRSTAQLRQEIAAVGTWQPGSDCFALAIERVDNPGMIGAISTRDTDPRSGSFSYGLAIARDQRRHGHATEAARILLRYMFTQRRYHKCLVDIHATNVASLRLHERLGFVVEGLLREQEYFDGRYQDVVLMGLLGPDFPATRGGAEVP
ncbi:GNAT family protein [Solwaraspora sp. WMMD791]|uniref:GNAT family N-acetyltransferase n=1 Tax=Solwaraspora sp. WMMD791 TaxID=3016086 RepID=UPI00249C0793|nr:GNAT family protein [Solwaraspora sp. WMMD791]WFE27983.1 GNAT family protein [Solwaraspora sp. WMMD791]